MSIQLKSFAAKATPIPTDIMYLGNSASNFDEVKSTIAEVVGAYPALSSIAGLTTVANEYIYTTGVNTYAVHAITSTPGAGILAAWDANLNLLANNFLKGFTTIATAATTTTLTVSSAEIQQFTGVTTQTIVMPLVSTLKIGQGFIIINSSSGALTINSSGGNLIQTVEAGTALYLNCILITGTTAASWYASILPGYPLATIYGGTGLAALGTGVAAALAANVLGSGGMVLASSVTVARAWVKYDGSSGAISASFNVSSVIDNGTGDQTIAYATTFTGNYAAVANIIPSSFIGVAQIFTVAGSGSQVKIYNTLTQAVGDAGSVLFTAHGNP
ncbi:MAG TPA: hypothetical protein VNU45_17940 [Rummeliibacillus sp.]|nr:hypothetical protein [Rummeliibacillus sp.]